MLIVLKSIFKEQKKWTIKKVCCWKNTKQFSLFTHKVIQNLMRLTLKRVRLLNQSLYLPPHSLLNWAWIYPKPCSLTLADSIPKATDKSNYFWRGCFWRAYHCVKCFCIRSYSGRYFPAVGLNMERYFISLRIQSECGIIRTRITPNTDIFYAVYSW